MYEKWRIMRVERTAGQLTGRKKRRRRRRRGERKYTYTYVNRTGSQFLTPVTRTPKVINLTEGVGGLPDEEFFIFRGYICQGQYIYIYNSGSYQYIIRTVMISSGTVVSVYNLLLGNRDNYCTYMQLYTIRTTTTTTNYCCFCFILQKRNLECI